jgi:hypothetical protein
MGGGFLGSQQTSLHKSHTTTSAVMSVSVPCAFPDVSIDFGFPPEKVNMPERLKGKKTIIVGLPGAFTPT